MFSFQAAVIQANITVESRVLIRDSLQLQVDLQGSRGFAKGIAQIKVGQRLIHAQALRLA
jgi:hypothetical protein